MIFLLINGVAFGLCRFAFLSKQYLQNWLYVLFYIAIRLLKRLSKAFGGFSAFENTWAISEDTAHYIVFLCRFYSLICSVRYDKCVSTGGIAVAE